MFGEGWRGFRKHTAFTDGHGGQNLLDAKVVGRHGRQIIGNPTAAVTTNRDVASKYELSQGFSCRYDIVFRR